MERLLAIAKNKADSAEIYYTSNNENHIQFENYALTAIKNKIQSGYGLRIIKDGFIGTSYTKNLLDRDALVESALSSLIGKVEASFLFPAHQQPGDFKSYDSSVEDLRSEEIIDDLKKISGYVKENCEGQFNVYSGYELNYIRILNSNGLDVEKKASSYFVSPMILFPNSYASINSMFYSTSFKKFPGSELKNMVALFSKALPEISPKTGNVQVIFSPETIYTLMWRVSEGTNAKSIYEGVSPIKDMVGEKIFSKKLTIVDDPHITGDPFSRGFDDEGAPTSKFILIDEGVLTGFYNNLDYASKLKVKPTGHGYRHAAWGGEAITINPSPKLANLSILPGDIPFKEMVKRVKRGILIMGALGAHSGNIPNGDFSIGLNPGLYIEDGEIKGRIKEGMVAGNIYDIMKRISSIENKVHWAYNGKFPSVCFDDVQFSAK